MAPHLFSENSVLHPPGPVKFSQSDKSVNCRYFLRNGASPQGIFPLCLRKKAACPPPWAAGRQAPAKARTAFVFLSKGAATQAGREPQRKLNGMPFFRWRSSAPSGKNPVEPCHAAFGGLLSAKLSRQTKTRGVPCRVAHSRHGIPLGSCLAKRPSLHFSRDVDARWAGAHVHTRQNAAFWLGWTYESVACPPVFIAFAPEMEA